MLSEKANKLSKTSVVLFSFLFYVHIINFLLSIIGISNETIISFIADLLYLGFVMYIYKEDIKENFGKYYDKHTMPRRFGKVIKWVAILILANLVAGILSEIFIDEQLVDNNTTSIYALSKISFVYVIFKTMIFAVVAEELVFKKSIRDIISNNYLFILMSSIIYTLLNIVYSDLTSSIVWISSLMYFIPSVVLCYMYVKNDDNIFMVMLVKFAFNTIPLSILLLGL